MYNYQQQKALAQQLGGFQSPANSGWAGALAQALAGLGGGYLGGKANQYENQQRQKLAEMVSTGNQDGMVNFLASSQIPEYQQMGLKTKMDTMQEAIKGKMLAEALNKGDVASLASVPGALDIATKIKDYKKPNYISSGGSLYDPSKNEWIDNPKANDPADRYKAAGGAIYDIETGEWKTPPANEAKADKDTKNLAYNMSKEFEDASKEFLKTRDGFVRIRESAKDPSPAGDLALIFNYMKILDPGSVVREGEFATAQNSASVPESIRARYNQIISGERLTDDQRSDFVNRATQLYNGAAKQHEGMVNSYTGRAEKFGVDPSLVIMDMGAFNDAPTSQQPSQSSQGAPQGARQAPDGNYYIPDPNRPGKYLQVVQ